MSNHHNAARSANAILGWPDLEGLTPLAADQNTKVSFIDQRIALNELLHNTLAHMPVPEMEGEDEKDEEQEKDDDDAPKPDLMQWEDVEKYFDTLTAHIPPAERAEFDKQREFARYATEHGTLPSDAGRLNLDRPERQLLWVATIVHEFGNGTIQEDDFARNPIVSAVTRSAFVDQMYNQLAYSLPAECKMVLGAPGSWFYFSPDPKNPRINLDLCHSLIAGGGLYAAQGAYLGHFEPIAHHEIGHAKFSRFYPDSMQELWKRMATLAAKGGEHIPEAFMPDGWKPPQYPHDSVLTIPEFKEYNALHAEFTLRQQFWNASEDNCVNRYSVNLGDPQHVNDAAQRHKGNLADSQNVFRTIIETNIFARHYQKTGAVKKEQDTPYARLGNLQHAVNMAFYFRNRIAPDTPAGRASLGIKDEWLPGANEAERAQTWENIKAITKRIEELQPHALDIAGRRYMVKDIHTDEMHNVNFDGKVVLYNRWRNEEIEKLFEIANPLLKEVDAEQRKKIDKRVEKLKNKKVMGGGGSGRGVRVEGLEGGQGGGTWSGTPQGQKDMDNGITPGTPFKNDGETADSRRKRQENGQAPPDESKPKKAVKPEDPYKHKSRNAMPMGRPSQGASNHASAMDAVELGDGRSYRELKQDPLYQAAVVECARILKEMSDEVSRTDTETAPAKFELPVGRDVVRQIDKERLRNLGIKLNRGDARRADINVKKRDKTIKKSVTHDLVEIIDGSGSMGTGKGSRLEVAMKTAALFYDATCLLAEDDRNFAESQNNNHVNTRYRLFISMWGDNEDWAKDPEAAEKYLIAEPGMDAYEAEARIERVLQGIQSGTLLSPAFRNILMRMQAFPLQENDMHGLTHFMIPSDGELFDANVSKEVILKLLDNMPNSTVDALITANSGNNELRELMEQIKVRYPERVNVTDMDWAHAPLQTIDMLQKRQRDMISNLEPIPEEEYQKQLAASMENGGMSR